MPDLITSPAIHAMEPSATMEMTQLARKMRAEGRDIVTLSMGEPDFDTPPHIREAAKSAIDQGETRYTAIDGSPALKEAIRAKFARDNALDYAITEVLATSGAKFLIYAAMIATIRPGDEVIIPAPYWVSYPDIVRLAGGVPVIVETLPEHGYIPETGAIEATITAKTRWLILNSPNNPTGAVIPEDRLIGIGNMLGQHPDLWVMTDDIYEQLSYGVRARTLPDVVPALKDRTLIVNGASKAYAMTGWRIGFGAGPAELISAIRPLLGQTTSNPSAISQAAAVAALLGDHGFLRDWRRAFEERRNLMSDQLLAIGLKAPLPDGAFYIFPSCEDYIGRSGPDGIIKDDTSFCRQLLMTQGVATVPGSAFGAPGRLRLSYAASMEQLEEALHRVRRYCERIA